MTALMMGVARDHLPEARRTATIALVSVTSTVGIGVGYPLAGLLTELGRVRAAYGLGLVVTAAAFLAAWCSVPTAPEGRSASVDVPGALLLAAGLVLVPFSAVGLVAGRLTPRLRRRVGPPRVLAGSAVVVLGAVVLFATARSSLAGVLASMAILGFGVGSFSAVIPAVILAVTPGDETSSAMSVTQVVRSVGFSFGSAVGGLVLAAGTGTDRTFPADRATIQRYYVPVDSNAE